MDRTEACELLNKSKEQNLVMVSSPHTFFAPKDLEEGVLNAAKRIDALSIAISVLEEDQARKELEYILCFAECGMFDFETYREQLRCLWTSYCFHHNLDVDTAKYDADLAEIWEKVSETESDTSDWSDLDSFDMFMCKYLV